MLSRLCVPITKPSKVQSRPTTPRVRVVLVTKPVKSHVVGQKRFAVNKTKFKDFKHLDDVQDSGVMLIGPGEEYSAEKVVDYISSHGGIFVLLAVVVCIIGATYYFFGWYGPGVTLGLMLTSAAFYSFKFIKFHTTGREVAHSIIEDTLLKHRKKIEKAIGDFKIPEIEKMLVDVAETESKNATNTIKHRCMFPLHGSFGFANARIILDKNTVTDEDTIRKFIIEYTNIRELDEGVLILEQNEDQSFSVDTTYRMLELTVHTGQMYIDPKTLLWCK